MARQGAYMLDVNLLEQLSDRIKYSGEKMADIDQQVISHINNVRETLGRQLDIIQAKLGEAKARLSEAESALQACEAMQAAAAAIGLPGSTCMLEAGAVAEAKAEVAKWEMRYAQGQQIVGECQQDIAGYNAGGHVLISNMSNQQTPKACHLLRGHGENLQDILNSDVSEQTEKPWAVLSENVEESTLANWRAISKNNKDLEKAMGIKQGEPMSVAEADMQKANPHYGESDEYGVNCATAVNAYVLRRRGFPVTAKGNHRTYLRHWYSVKEDRNYWVSQDDNVFKVWKNTDGSETNPKYIADWMKDNSINAMTADDYKKYFDETCKDKGIYIFGLRWKGGEGHATILERDDQGLHLIEPQVYESNRTTDGRRNIDDLISHVKNGESGLSMYPRPTDGIMRVDDKIFDPKYVDLFDM